MGTFCLGIYIDTMVSSAHHIQVAMQKLLENGSDGHFVLDLETQNISSASTKSQKLFGVSSCCGIYFEDFVQLDDHGRFNRMLAEARCGNFETIIISCRVSVAS